LQHLKSAAETLFLHTCFGGSIVGGILLVGSLYTMLWGKIKESKTCDVRDDTEKDGREKSAENCPEEQEQTATEVRESSSIGASASRVEEL